MKENKTIIFSVITIVLVIGACIGAFFYFTREDKKEVAEEISKEPVYTSSNFPKIDASTATQPLARAFFKNFTGTSDEDFAFNFTQTHQSYEKLINGDVDLILVTQPSEDELALAKSKNIELEVIPVVREGFVFYVNAKNPINNLTVEQVQGIYSGDITNWSKVGGENIDIKPYQRPENSGSQTGMIELVMKDKKLMEPLTENVVSSMAGIINLVSSYDNGNSSIGYSYYYYATTMYQTIDKEVASNIKLIGINGVKPTSETIKSGEYPFTTSYYIVINKTSDDNSIARKLANLMLSARGQNVAKEAGYVPVK